MVRRSRFGALLLTACGTTAPSGDTAESSDGSTTAATASVTGTTADTTTPDSSTTVATSDATTTGGADDSTGVTPTPDECITDVAPGHHSVECDGLTFEIEVPEACVQQPCGMIFDVHGFTMSAQMQDANTGMRALGQTHGFIVVQPSANPAPPAASWNPDVDDDKVFAFMQRVATVWDVDPDRWHFTGFSQGGFMSWRFICDHADVLASVAPAAACGDGGAFEDCSFTGDQVPSEPIDVLYLHGTTDALVGYGCAEPRVAAVVEHFGLGPAQMVQQDDTHRWTRHEGDAMVLEFVSHDYAATSPILGGHCYPGSTDPGDAPGQLFPFGCVEPNAFVWGEVAMQFFRDHPR